MRFFEAIGDFIVAVITVLARGLGAGLLRTLEVIGYGIGFALPWIAGFAAFYIAATLYPKMLADLLGMAVMFFLIVFGFKWAWKKLFSSAPAARRNNRR